VYGPLCNGATTVLFEGVATYPNCEQYWEMVDRLKLTHLYTIPTVIKFLMKAGDDHVDKYNLSSLRVLALAGEPVTSGVQDWCYSVVGRGKCLLLDTWGQTETGSIAIIRWLAPEGKKPTTPSSCPPSPPSSSSRLRRLFTAWFTSRLCTGKKEIQLKLHSLHTCTQSLGKDGLQSLYNIMMIHMYQ